MSKVFPKISIVTPSYNQGEYIEQTIQSVLGQFYENIEYLVLDAASKDETVSILEKYESQISYWHSKPDGGQSAAINEGFKKSTGDIIAWLNSDDYYLTSTLNKVAELLPLDKPVILMGNCFHFQQGKDTGTGSLITEWHNEIELKNGDYIIQPSTFFNRKAWDLVGELNESLHFTFDWEWFLRAEEKGVEFIVTSDYFSVYRLHEAHKSSTGGEKRDNEIYEIVKKYNSKEDTELFFYILQNKNVMKERLTNLSSLLNTQRLKSQLFRQIFFRKLSKSEWNKVDIFMKVNGLSI